MLDLSEQQTRFTILITGRKYRYYHKAHNTHLETVCLQNLLLVAVTTQTHHRKYTSLQYGINQLFRKWIPKSYVSRVTK